jgi:hypothetical protein
MRAWCGALALSLGLAIAGSAFGQPAAGKTAEALFDEARALMQKEQYAEACKKFEESQALDPASGTMLNLADCYAKRQLIASAWQMFTDAGVAARAEGDSDRAAEADRRAANIEPNVSRLTITVTNPPRGFVLRRDGKTVEPAAYGNAVAVDPGEHVIEADAPGHVKWTQRTRISLTRSDRQIVVPALEPVQKSAPPKPPPEGDGPNSLVVAGSVLGALGLAGIGVGIGFGVHASAQWDDALTLCPTKQGCSTDAVELGSDAGTSADVSTAAFFAGGALLGTGIVLFIVGLTSEPANEGADRAGRVSVGRDSLVVNFW